MVLLSRRTSSVLLCCLGLFLLGTVCVLSLVRVYFEIDSTAYVLHTELGTLPEIAQAARPSALSIAADAQLNATDVPKEHIPRIIHQTWKTETLPPRWAKTREECARMMSDYQYMLWTDQSARALIASDYPWFLPVFDAYPYNIQRADAIRYFVLHKYGGVYMDLDIGCKRRLDSLLRFEAIVPKTIPVGVSNDLMFAAKGHPLMSMLIDNLARFNHHFLTPYATVMFSTGPMFVSAVCRMYADANPRVLPSTREKLTQGFKGVRVLPKSLYGKNTKPDEAPDAFFEHMYGSSWHEGDAGFLIFLRIHGRLLMAIGLTIVLYGLRRYYLGAIFSLFAFLADRDRFSFVSLRRWLRYLIDESSGTSPDWVRLSDQDAEDGMEESASKPIPLFRQEEPLQTEAPAVPPIFTPVARPASRSSYIDQDPAALEEHCRRTAYDDTALGSYSKRQENRGGEETNLPAYYVDGASEYAMDNSSLVLDEDEEQPRGRSRRSFNLSRLRPSWRSLSVAPLKSLVTRPSRRSTGPESDVGDLDKISVEGEPMSHQLSSQSEEYHHEFASLVQGNNKDATSNLLSPSLRPTASPPPTVLISQEQEYPTHHHGAVVRRQPTGDLTRAMTPAVPSIPQEDFTPNQDRLRLPNEM